MGESVTFRCPVARRLREAREREGLSQRALGIAAGMDPSSASARINHYERERHTPDYLTLSQLALVLKRPVAWFYAEQDDLAEVIAAYTASRRQQE